MGRSNHAPNEDGFVLVSVLYVVVLIALIASSLLAMVRIIANDNNMFISEMTARLVTEAGLNRAIMAFSVIGDPLRQDLLPDDRPIEWAFRGNKVFLRVQAESGKLDLNAADRAHLVALLERVIDDQRIRSDIIGNIDSSRISGLRLPSTAAALSIRDRHPIRLSAIASNFTVFTNQVGFDPSTARPLVLESIPDLSAEFKASWSDMRRRGEPLPLDRFAGLVATRFVSERPIYTFYAETGKIFHRAWAMSAVVGFSEQGNTSIHSWSPVGVRQ